MRLLFPADLVFCSVLIHIEDYLVAPDVELLCLVLIFFDEIVKLQNVALQLFKDFSTLNKPFLRKFKIFLVQALDYGL